MQGIQPFERFLNIGIAIDLIHIGAGGARLDRVDLPIVRDPVTRIPKIPGSSLAGAYRAYVAMAENRYPNCAGQGQSDAEGKEGHCGKPDCPVCAIFGYARGQSGGFAGLAMFSDAHVLLFPVATRKGPIWVTSPMALQPLMEDEAGMDMQGFDEAALYMERECPQPLNLGWLLLPVKEYSFQAIKEMCQAWGVPSYITDRLGLLPDGLFSQVVNSNLEVRTSVSIHPETGTADDGALFSYEALPRSTALYWEIISKNPRHFKIGGQEVAAVADPDDVYRIARKAHDYFEFLGIGGMSTRGMGRLKVIHSPGLPPAGLSGHAAGGQQGGERR